MKSVQHLTIKLRLKDKHSSCLNAQARSVNIVWNYCNEVSRKAWQRDGCWLSDYDLHALTAGSSKELGLHSGTVQRVCTIFVKNRDFRKKSSLRWRGRKSLGWVPFNAGHLKFDGECFKYNGNTFSSFHTGSRLTEVTRSKAGSFSQDAKGNWYLNFSIEVELGEGSRRPPVGVDLGIKNLATLSDGNVVINNRFLKNNEKSISFVQKLGKTKRARNIHRKVANRRKDFLHKESLKISQKYGFVVVGGANPSDLAKGRLIKPMQDVGWSIFKHMLSYKALMHGGRMIEVNEAYTSQTCSTCGSRPASRPRGIAGLGIREWQCDDCETVHDRDVNAARNILRIGLDTLAEGTARMRSSHEVKVVRNNLTPIENFANRVIPTIGAQ